MMVLLIPAFEPDVRLVGLVTQLRAAMPEPIVVVDDGSGPGYRDLFAVVRELGATVLTSTVNRGKGAALKTGFRHIRSHHPGEDVICVDSDGQHAVDDVARVAARLAEVPDVMVLGARQFTGTVPLRSRVGNTVARRSFRMATGRDLGDTQTGLRGYPSGMLDWLVAVPGERFEYELNTLLSAPGAGIGIEEVPIETIYLDGNASSHFRPVVDSLRVARPLLAYGAVSIASFVLDALLVLLLANVTGSLLVAAVFARLASGSVNFLLNRQVVFRERRRALGRSAVLYAGLAVLVLAAGWAGLEVLTNVGVPLIVAKVVTDVALYLITFVLQRRVVFRASGSTARSVARSPGGGTRSFSPRRSTPMAPIRSSTADATRAGSVSVRR
jgi:putative flippase GtrA